MMVAFQLTNPELAQLRECLVGKYTIFVPPAEDGAASLTDSINIQAAIDTLQATVPEWNTGTVVVSGFYATNKMLTLGAPGVKSRVRLVGLGFAKFNRWISNGGPYILQCFGKSSPALPVLGNLTINGDYKTRGILCSQVTTSAPLENIYIYATSEVALDLLDHYCTSINNVFISGCRGYAIRACWANALKLNSCYIGGNKGIFDKTNITSAADKELIAYAMEFGQAAAFAKYPNATETWPSATDTSCTPYTGKPWATPDEARACIYWHGYGGSFDNVTIESNAYVDYPLIYLPPKWPDHAEPCAIGNHFLHTYLEGNKNRLEKVLIKGSSYNTFRDTIIVDGGEPGEFPCETFMRLKGNTRGNVLNRLNGWGNFSKGLAILDGGTHLGTEVTQCATNPVVGDHLVAINGGIDAEASTQFSSVN